MDYLHGGAIVSSTGKSIYFDNKKNYQNLIHDVGKTK